MTEHSSTSALIYLAGGVCAAVGTYRTLSHILDQSQYELEYCIRHAPRGPQPGSGRRRNAWYGGRRGSASGTQATNSAEADAILASPTLLDSLGALALR
ncbi:hypothetical protein GGI05_004108, partial [Coemansia sp. RSA 2603]